MFKERFVAEFVGGSPVPMLAIVEDAVQDGLSEWKAHKLLKQAEA